MSESMVATTVLMGAAVAEVVLFVAMSTGSVPTIMVAITVFVSERDTETSGCEEAGR